MRAMRPLLALLVPWVVACGPNSHESAPFVETTIAAVDLDETEVGAGELMCAPSSVSAYMAEVEDAARGICDSAPFEPEPVELGDGVLVAVNGTPNGLGAPSEMGGACQTRIRALLSVEGLDGASGLQANRARVLSYAKAEPVAFTRTPEFSSTGSPAARAYRSMLERTSSPWSLLQKLTLVFTANPALGRSVLLREGYLYAEKPELAFALVDLVKAHHLFDAPEIWIHRGEEVLKAERTPYGQYVYADGPQRGQRVRLLLFDRIGTGELPAPIHRDFRSLRRRLGFDRADVRHITEEELLVELHYGGLTIPTVLESRGARLELACELLTPDLVPRVAAARSRQARRLRVQDALRRAMLASVEEGLPFDEPRTEYGQQDGQLRRFWLRAYMEGRSTYEINGDRYNTFDSRGRPLVPQVCVDFVFDTFERASGTWWRSKGEPPGRTAGALDFGTVKDETLRRVSAFLDLAATRTDWFETWEVPENERIPLKYSSTLVEYLTTNAQKFIPGDVVLIRGYAPWDKPWQPRIMHYHSFFVYETDPLTGFPSMLVGNPGKPLLQTWQFEAFRTPERSIWYRLRPRLEWLESVIPTDTEDGEALAYVPLAAGPN